MRIVVCFMLSLAFVGNAQDHASRLDKLEFLVGEWNVTANVRLSKEGPWEKSEARSSIRKVVGNTVLEEDFSGTRNGHQFTAKSWIGNDNRTGRYQKVFVDSGHGVLVLFEGLLEDGKLTLETTFHIGEAVITSRSLYTFTSDDEFLVESLRSTDQGKTWDKTGELRYKKIN